MTDTGSHDFYLATTDAGLQVTFALATDEDGKPQRWQTILSVGKGEGRPLYGSESPSFSLKKLKAYVKAFKAWGKRPSVDVHHARLQALKEKDPRFLIPELSGSRAKLADLRIKGDDLQAAFDWTKAGAKVVAEGLLTFPSVEIGKVKGVGETVVGCTLTDNPFWNVPAFAMSRGRIESIDSQAGGAMVEPNENPSESNTPDVNEEESMDIKALSEQLGCEATEEAVTAALSGLQDDIKAKDAEITAMSDRHEAALTADFDRELADRVFADGRMKDEPKAREALRTVYDTDRDAFVALCDAMKPGTVPTREPEGHDAGPEPTGDDAPKAKTAQDAGNQLHALAEGLVDPDKGIDYVDAYTKVCADNPDLVEAYELGDGREA